MWAIKIEPDPELVKLLLDHGAHTTRRTGNNGSALEEARKMRDGCASNGTYEEAASAEIFAMLEQHEKESGS